MLRSIAAILLGLSLSATVLAEDANIRFPDNYRETFTNYLNLDRTQNHDQIIHLWANDVALKGLNETGVFPDGSVLIGEVYKAKKDGEGAVIESILGQRIRGKLALVAVMEKQEGWGDSFPEEFKNGDWDFAAFKPDGSVNTKKDLNACRACHVPLSDFQHVFSIEHMQ